MIAETVHAAKNNLAKHGAAFSWRGPGVFASAEAGLVDNATAYIYLVSNGYFEEGKRQGKPVIIPTDKLLDELEAFFTMK